MAVIQANETNGKVVVLGDKISSIKLTKANLSNKLKNCKKYINKVMPMICDVLDDVGYKYTINDTQTEIIVNKRSLNKSKLQSTVLDKVDIPKTDMQLLVSVYQVKNNIFIRLKRK